MTVDTEPEKLKEPHPCSCGLCDGGRKSYIQQLKEAKNPTEAQEIRENRK